jgi:integrase
MTLNQAFGRYYEDHAARLPSASDCFRQLGMLSDLLDSEKRLSEIGDDEISMAIARRRGMTAYRKKTLVSNATVNREIELLRRVYRKAVKAWKINVGDMPDWREHLLPEADERTRKASEVEEDAILTALREDYRPLFEFAFLSGIRLSNLRLLTWTQVDFSERILRLSVKSRKPGGRIVEIPITGAMLTLLANQAGHHPIYVFTYVCARSRGLRRKGERYPFSKNGWRKEWAWALEAAGVSDFRFHDIRHTAARRTMAVVGNPKIVQQQLGHASINSTMKYLARIIHGGAHKVTANVD